MREGRSQFNPCQYASRLYLSGGNNLQIDCFDLTARCFVNGPAVYLNEATASMSWISDGVLSIFTIGFMTKIDLKVGSVVVSTHPRGGFHFRAAPVLYQGYVFFVLEDGAGCRMKVDEEVMRIEELT